MSSIAAVRKLGVYMLVALSGLALAVALSGCGGGGGNTGTLSVSLTDASGPYANVFVSIKAIYAVPTGQGEDPTGVGLPLIASFNPSRVVDVLTLQYVQQVLGSAAVPAGSYEQLRLVLDPNPATGDPVNYVTLNSDPTTKLPLDTPSGQQSGLKILGDFTVVAGQLTALTLDFDPSRAVVNAGNSGRRNLKPTGIRIVQTAEQLATYGSLSGSVAPDLAWPSAIVSIVPQNSTVAIAAGAVNPDDGSFRAFVPAGVYSIRVTATGYTSYDSSTVPLLYTLTVGADTAVDAITLTAAP